MNINGQNQYGQLFVRLHLDSGIVSGDGIREGQVNVVGAGGRQNTFTSVGTDGRLVFAISYDPGSAIRVRNLVVNDDDGQNTPADFTIGANGRNVRIDPPQGRSQDTLIHLSPGNYEVSQQEAIGYETTYEDGCNGIIRAGQDIQCTIVNDDVVLTAIVPGLENTNPTVPALQGEEDRDDVGDGSGGEGEAGPSLAVPGLDMPPDEKGEVVTGDGGAGP